MSDIDWEGFVRKLLELEEERIKYLIPTPIKVLVQWDFLTYIGHIQRMYIDYSDKIVLLNKNSSPISFKAFETIQKLDPDRIILTVDTNIDLIGRKYILILEGDRLMKLSSSDMEYIKRNPPLIMDLERYNFYSQKIKRYEIEKLMKRKID